MNPPRILHRIWFGGPMPEEFVEYGERFRELNPRFSVIEWTDPDDVPLMINEHLFQFAEQIFPDDHLRFRADVLRLELLWLYGGVYLDCDVQPVRSFEELDDHPVFAGFEPHRGPRGERALGTAVLGAKPHSAFIGRAINELPASVKAHPGQRLAFVAGPWHLTRIWEQDPSAIHVYDERVFYPQSIGQRNRGIEPEITDETFTVHHWSHSRRKARAGSR